MRSIYVEPFATYDIDIFITFISSQSGLLTLAPIYDYLAVRGCKAEGEALIIEDWAVQFLPVFDPLLEESLEQACDIEFASVPTRVFKAEHLVAIMLQTGRAKIMLASQSFLKKMQLTDKRFRLFLQNMA